MNEAVPTAFDVVSSILSAAVYLGVALAALAYAPRDPRVRVFLATAIAAVAQYSVTVVIWMRGPGQPFSRAAIGVFGLSLMIGSLALFHFTQLFPWRRPWIRAHAARLWAGYAAVALVTIAAVILTPDLEMPPGEDLGVFTSNTAIALIVAGLAIGVPVLIVVGVITPLAGLLSLYRSWATARAKDIPRARVTTFWMIVSQMGGGVLTIVIIPLLHLVAPSGPWVTVGAALLFGCGLLMPIAFGVGVWGLGVLDLGIDELPQ